MRITAKILAPGLFLLLFLAIGTAFLWSDLTRVEAQLAETNQLFKRAQHHSDDLLILHQQQVIAALQYQKEPSPQAAQALVDTNRETRKVTDQLSVLFEEIGDPAVLTNYRIAQGGAFSLYNSLVISIDTGNKPLEESTLSRLSIKGQQIRATLSDLRVYYSKKLDLSIHQTEAEKKRALLMFVWFITVVMAIIAGFAVYQALAIARPIRHLTSVARRISDGHDEPPRATGRRDEIGELSRAFGEMLARLAERTAEVETKEERYRSLYNDTPAMLHSLDQDMRIIMVSDYWLSYLGYTRDEVIGRKVTDFQTEASRQTVKKNFPLLKMTGKVEDVALQFLKSNGDVIDVSLSGILTMSAQGGESRSLAVMIDVTEEKRAKEALSKALESEKEYTALQSKFISLVSHEFRTP